MLGITVAMRDAETFREQQASSTDAVVDAVGKASEALEYVERARGHLYALHQLTGRADLLFEEAAVMLTEAGEVDAGTRIANEVVGRNVLDGRWTFQIVEEYDAQYYDTVTAAVRELESQFQGGRRHVYEARMKEARRTVGLAGHEHRPPTSHDRRIEVDAEDDRAGSRHQG